MKTLEGMVMKKLLSVVLIIMMCATLSVGCSSGTTTTPPSTTTAEPVALNVFAAASLTEALNEIAALYKVKNPDVSLVFNFDSSGKLQTQIENGAEADLFLSAATRQMTALADGGYVDEATQKDLLLNRVVLIVPGDSENGITSYEDVATDKVSLIALGNADVPCGQYAEEIFKSLGEWDAIQTKISFGGNVKEILSQVENGSVDAGVVYSTDVATATGDIKIAADAPEGSHAPVIYPAAVLKGAKDTEAAKAFLDYLSASEAVAVFEKIGFTMVK
ncbi:MAG: molybdate ABC transporter substrate-binding protein [Syntrophomonadaceae bacterium]|nr:molybdate ABC transporter substrate-binding protein [Syntrophomonadaceae bacterium]